MWGARARPIHARRCVLLLCCRRVKMTRLRQRVAERLKGAQNTAALLTTFNEIDMSSLMEMRSTYKVRAVAFAGAAAAWLLLPPYVCAARGGSKPWDED